MLSDMGNNIGEQTSRSAHGGADGLAMRTGDSHTRIAEAAARLARKLHTGQKDKAGQDYFDGHLSTVATLGNDWKEQTVGYLHDAAEDTPCTVDEIILTLKTECPDILQEAAFLPMKSKKNSVPRKRLSVFPSAKKQRESSLPCMK